MHYADILGNTAIKHPGSANPTLVKNVREVGDKHCCSIIPAEKMSNEFSQEDQTEINFWQTKFLSISIFANG